MFEGLDMPTCDTASVSYRKWNSRTVHLLSCFLWGAFKKFWSWLSSAILLLC